MEERAPSKPTVRKRAEEIKQFRCKNLIAVIESPTDVKNIGTVIRNVNALGVEKVYVVDPRRSLPDDWQDLRSAADEHESNREKRFLQQLGVPPYRCYASTRRGSVSPGCERPLGPAHRLNEEAGLHYHRIVPAMDLTP